MFVVMIIKTLQRGRLILSDAAALWRDVRLLLMATLNFPNVTFYQLSGELANLYLMLSTFSPPQKPENVPQTGGSDAVAPQREAAEDPRKRLWTQVSGQTPAGLPEPGVASFNDRTITDADVSVSLH